jgi:hypothetical protein
MATNLFEAFDAAFTPEQRPGLAEMVAARMAALRAAFGARMARRRQRRMARQVMALPPHILKDIGYIAWDGRLWRQAHSVEPRPETA